MNTIWYRHFTLVYIVMHTFEIIDIVWPQSVVISWLFEWRGTSDVCGCEENVPIQSIKECWKHTNFNVILYMNVMCYPCMIADASYWRNMIFLILWHRQNHVLGLVPESWQRFWESAGTSRNANKWVFSYQTRYAAGQKSPHGRVI